MKNQKVQILAIEQVTHDVRGFRVQKPAGISFTPGQATEISVDQEGWKGEGRPFTFTSLPEDDYLELIIKRYPSHEGVTDRLHQLEEGDSLIMNDVFGAIQYSGKGLFVAGGAGITPFIAIFRDLHRKGELEGNRLLFANKTAGDIILKQELEQMLGGQFINILSEEEHPPHLSGFISRELIVDQLTTPGMKVYVCGPPPMMDSIGEHLAELEIPGESIITEAL